MTHEQLYLAVCGGNDPSAVYDVSDKWTSLGNNMLESANTLHQQVAASSAGWQGEAAESSRDAVSQLVGWGGKAGATAQVMGQQLNQQGQVMATAKTNMPGPFDFDLDMAAMVDPGLAGFASSVIDSQPGQQMAQEQYARAIDVAVAMERDSAQIDADTPEFEPVPTVISPRQVSPLLPFSNTTPVTPAEPDAPLAPEEPFQMAQPALTGTTIMGAPLATPASPPVTGVPVTSQPHLNAPDTTTTQGYQPPVSPSGYQPVSPAGYQPPVSPVHQPSPNPAGNPTGWSPSSEPPPPPNIYTVPSGPSGQTIVSGYPGPSTGGPGPGMPNPSNGWPSTTSWPSGGPTGPGIGSPPGGNVPVGGFPGGSFPGGGFPGGSFPEGEFPGGVPGGGGPGSSVPGGGFGPGASGAGPESMRGYQPGAISSRLGSSPAGARANAGASETGAGAVDAEREAAGAGSLGSAAGRTSSTPGMPGGGGSKRKEEDKEHKSAGYVEGEDIFEPLGGELPPAVIGERRLRTSK